MRNKVNKILLDTTYLLPFFEIETDKFSKDDLQLLMNSSINLFYNPISLVEIKWVLIRLSKRDKARFKKLKIIYSDAVDHLVYSDEIKQTLMLNGKISYLEDILLEAGVKDYFDRVIAATAKIFTGVLLTEDKELTKIVRSVNEFKDLEIMNWRELSRIIF